MGIFKALSTPSILSAIQKLTVLLTRKEKMQWVGILVLAFCMSLLEVITTAIVMILAQVLNQPEIGQTYLSKIGMKADLSAGRIVFYVAVIAGVIYMIKNIIGAIEIFYQNFSIQKMNYYFKNKLLHRYVETDYGFYLTRNSSFGLQVIEGDVEHLFSNGMIALAAMISEGFVFVCLIGMIILMDPSLALIIFSIGAICSLIITKFLFPQFYRWGQLLQDTTLACSQHLLQFFHAFKEVVLLGTKEAFVSAYNYHSRKRARVQAIKTATNGLPRVVLEILFVGLFMAAIAYLCFEHESPVQMIGILGGYFYVGFRLMPGLNRIINLLNSFKMVIPSIERIYTEFTSIEAQNNYHNIPNLTFENSIILSDVSFHYLNTHKDILKHVNLEINKGECIGIVGETGSGKSTLIDLILGLLKPCEGSILVDQYPVNSYQWHQKIGYVPQSIYLTDDTVEANIAFGEKKIDGTKLNNAIDAAQLRKFVSNLPDGSKTIVGERGVRLSGGERQRIAIARALYRNPEILIFDEATSALDNETEARLMETIYAVSQDRTVIMIAHRLTTLKNCGRIIKIENGKIKKDDSKVYLKRREELLSEAI